MFCSISPIIRAINNYTIVDDTEFIVQQTLCFVQIEYASLLEKLIKINYIRH